MSIEFPRLSGLVSFDTETRDPDLQDRGPGWAFKDGGEIIGFSMAWDGGRCKHYWPIAHASGNYPREKCLAWLKSVMAQTDITWVMYNRMYDEGWLRYHGIPVKGVIVDAYTAVPLLDEYRTSYHLDDVAHDYLGVGKDETGIIEFGKRMGLKKSEVKANLWRMPAGIVRPYAEQDAVVTLQLWEALLPQLEAESLLPIFQLETKLLPILLEMRFRGIRVDLDRAEQAVAKYKREEARLAKEIHTLAGVPVDIWANESIGAAFDRLGLRYHRTPKTNVPSFRAPWLKAHPDRLAQLIVQQRVLNKTRTTFLESYILQKAVNGRIHPQVNPLPSEEGGAVTGRPSVTKPNMNNLPNVEKDPVNGKLVRGCMLPEEGEEWAAIDYSQQEPRLMVHFAEGMRARGSREAGDRYRANPRMDFHNMMADITGLIRKQAKNIFLGRCYGMGGAKYCHDVGLPTKIIQRRRGNRMEEYEVPGEEGQAQLDQFNENVPWVEGLSKEAERRAKRKGYITTILGRRCRFGGGPDKKGKRDWFYKALNRLIQGSAADQTKKAMVDAWEAGAVPLVTVYDELGFSVPHRQRAEELGEIMTSAVPLRVPSVVDIEMGPSWGDSV